MPVFGLVVAGNYDEAALRALLRQMRPDLADVVSRQCGNDFRVTTTYKTVLKELRFANNNRSVDKAIVVRDGHGVGATEALRQMSQSYDPNESVFPVEFAVVAPELEAWLLADHNARTQLSREMGRFVNYPPLDRSPEALPSPKAKLQELLARAGISYTAPVAARIGELSNIEMIEQLCPSFTLFIRAAHNC